MSVFEQQFDLLYHITETIIAPRKSQYGVFPIVTILDTFSSLPYAKANARHWLRYSGYEKSLIKEIHENLGLDEWIYGEATTVHAETFSGYHFYISLYVTTNEQRLMGDGKGRIRCPLHYVLRTRVWYNTDWKRLSESIKIEGPFASRLQGIAVARMNLLHGSGSLQDFVLYEESDDLKDWNYGSDVIVHATALTGEEFLVAVKSRWESGNGSQLL